MAGRKYYVTAAIDYANGLPHLGHALEKIEADCIARYRRLLGDQVHFLIGMDEHGQKVAQAAQDNRQSPQAWVDQVAAEFRRAWQILGISQDDFIRTTERRHQKAVQVLLERIRQANPDAITEGTYSGHYCIGCEAFKLPRDLVDGRCAEHPTLDIKWLEERNHFFRLSALADRLLDHYRQHPDFVTPASKMNEVRKLVEGGLQDISISRSRLAWGIPFPGSSEHTVYVWFDALINYLSGTGFPKPEYEKLWPADLHIIGPDITRFHAVIWPAMLMAAEVPVPTQIWAHGWLNTSGARFSKTAGVHVTLDEAVGRYGPDALRYFLLCTVPWDGDGDFSWELFDSLYTSALADNIGNLASRTVAMITRYCEGRVANGADETVLDREHAEYVATYKDAMDNLRLNEGGQLLRRLGDAANRYVDSCAPWKLAKQDATAELEKTLAALHRALIRIAALATPFMPRKAQELYRMIGGSGNVTDITWAAVDHHSGDGWHVTAQEPLFPKPRGTS